MMEAVLQDDLNMQANNDGIIFKAINSKTVGSCEVRVFILMQSNGSISAGYTHEGSGCSNDLNGFVSGTRTTIDSNMVLRIETPLT